MVRGRRWIQVTAVFVAMSLAALVVCVLRRETSDDERLATTSPEDTAVESRTVPTRRARAPVAPAHRASEIGSATSPPAVAAGPAPMRAEIMIDRARLDRLRAAVGESKATPERMGDQEFSPDRFERTQPFLTLFTIRPEDIETTITFYRNQHCGLSGMTREDIASNADLRADLDVLEEAWRLSLVLHRRIEWLAARAGDQTLGDQDREAAQRDRERIVTSIINGLADYSEVVTLFDKKYPLRGTGPYPKWWH